MVNFIGLPRVERSTPPVDAPPTLRTTSRNARPMVALARLPAPKAPSFIFMPIFSRIGPLMIITGAAPMVVAVTPWMLNASVQAASTAAMMTGKYSGLHPAITALIAIFSTVASPMFGGTVAMTSWGLRCVPPSMRITRSGVGGTRGNPSEKPWSNMNSATSSLLATSMRRARIGLPSASARNLS